MYNLVEQLMVRERLGEQITARASGDDSGGEHNQTHELIFSKLGPVGPTSPGATAVLSLERAELLLREVASCAIVLPAEVCTSRR